ncbi:hypothetical protein [Oleidesulfovibrio sp.]|uniref:hypothetical protein n=1 Tax=Oleidesulfovibrio sp. TaxID=2909707 RepID=UPI003A85E354
MLYTKQMANEVSSETDASYIFRPAAYEPHAVDRPRQAMDNTAVSYAGHPRFESVALWGMSGLKQPTGRKP